VSIEELGRFYDAIVLSYGAETDKRLVSRERIAGQPHRDGVRRLVHAHPDYRDRVFDFSSEVAVVIGQGNVAMDVSRILAKTVDELKATDIADYALDALSRSRVREIHLVGRRDRRRRSSRRRRSVRSASSPTAIRSSSPRILVLNPRARPSSPTRKTDTRATT